MAKKTIIYQVVKNDIELDGGLIAIDAWYTKKYFNDDGEGTCIGTVNADGEFKFENGLSTDLQCANVQKAIAQAQEKQLEKKQEVVDEVIEEQKKAFEYGDFT